MNLNLCDEATHFSDPKLVKSQILIILSDSYLVSVGLVIIL